MWELRIKLVTRYTLLALMCSALAMPAFAVEVPGSARIERVDEKVKPRALTPSLDENQTAVEQGESAIEMPEGADKVEFVLHSLTVEGVTVYSKEDLKPYYAPHIGKKVSVATVYQIAGAITKRYQDDGYVISRVRVPAQEIDGGKVVLQATEGYVSKVRFSNDILERGPLRSLAENIVAMRPLHLPTLQYMLLAMDGMNGLSVRSVIEPAASKNTEAGAVGMLLNVERKRFSANLSVDNYGSLFVGPWQGNATVSLFDTLLDFDSLQLRTFSTLERRELYYGDLAWRVPLDPYGTYVEVGVNHARSYPGANLEVFEIKSTTDKFNGMIRNLWYNTRSAMFETRIMYDYKNSKSDLLYTRFSHDITNAIRFNASGQYADEWFGTTLADMTLSQGLDILGTRESGSADLSRAEGRSDFTKIEATLTRLQYIGQSWLLVGTIAGQYSSDPLLASEEFGYGGSTYGRAYDASEITGDSGIIGSAELRYNGLAFFNNSLSTTPFVFYDIGRVWENDTGGTHVSAASAGFGVKLAHTYGVNASATVAFPLTKPIANPIDGGNGKSPRFGFSLSYQF